MILDRKKSHFCIHSSINSKVDTTEHERLLIQVKLCPCGRWRWADALSSPYANPQNLPMSITPLATGLQVEIKLWGLV